MDERTEEGSPVALSSSFSIACLVQRLTSPDPSPPVLTAAGFVALARQMTGYYLLRDASPSGNDDSLGVDQNT